MAMLLDLALLGIIGICVALLHGEGLWGNALTFVNTTISALLAFSFFEPLANLAQQHLPSFTYFWDFLSLWLLFAASMGILQQLSKMLSKVKVRFRKPVALVGAYFFALLTGWVLTCFTAATLHTAPMPRVAFLGGLTPEKELLFGQKPDRVWLNFVQTLSKGPLSSSAGMFDPDATYILRYADRREALEAEPALRAAAK